MEYTKITRKSFYLEGGLSNPHLVRVTRGGSWAYYRRAV